MTAGWGRCVCVCGIERMNAPGRPLYVSPELSVFCGFHDLSVAHVGQGHLLIAPVDTTPINSRLTHT